MRKFVPMFVTLLLIPLTSQAFRNFDHMFSQMTKEMAELKETLSAQDERHIESGYNATEKKYFFQIKLHDFTANDIKVQIREDNDSKFIMLIAHKEISGKGISEKKDFQFMRSLPKDADVNKTEWKFENNIITIKVPKALEPKENWIKIERSR